MLLCPYYCDSEKLTEDFLLKIGAIDKTEPYHTCKTYCLVDRICFYFWYNERGYSVELSGGGDVICNTLGDLVRLCDSLGVRFPKEMKIHDLT